MYSIIQYVVTDSVLTRDLTAEGHIKFNDIIGFTSYRPSAQADDWNITNSFPKGTFGFCIIGQIKVTVPFGNSLVHSTIDSCDVYTHHVIHFFLVLQGQD